MKYFLVEYRFSHPSFKEVFLELENNFEVVISFETHFLIKTEKSKEYIQNWIEENLPYSLRDLVEGHI